MVAERVAELIFTDWFEVYVPAAGLKVGVAAVGVTTLYEAEPTALLE
jgi:hypothetical protein